MFKWLFKKKGCAKHMNNKLEVIGIDHGWSMMKTISQALPDYHRVTINRTERNAYIPFGKLAGLEYVYSFLAFSASVTSKKEIKQHEKRTGYFNNKQQSDGGERHEE